MGSIRVDELLSGHVRVVGPDDRPAELMADGAAERPSHIVVRDREHVCAVLAVGELKEFAAGTTFKERCGTRRVLRLASHTSIEQAVHAMSEAGLAAAAVVDSDGAFIGVVTLDDVAKKLAEVRAAAATIGRESLLAALENSVIVAVTDRSGKITEVNEAFCRISGYTREELLGEDHRIVNSGVHPKRMWSQMWRAISKGEVWRSEVCNRAKSGRLYWVDTTVAPVRDAEGRVNGYVGVRVDISDRKRIEEELRSIAYIDSLTGLGNRAVLRQLLEQAHAASRNDASHRFGVLFLDFDGFKRINDTLGHEVGDRVLREIAERLRRAVSRGERPEGRTKRHLARLGGDEFIVLLDGLADAEEAIEIAESLLGIFAEPFRIGRHEVFSTVSIGIAIGDSTAREAEEVLCNADIAMYEAKIAGKGRWVQFSASMRERVQRRASLENALRNAIDSGQLFLVYQPIMSLETRAVEGLEALIRWEHPEYGLVRPDEFIPIAEQTGLIVPIGEWVIREACRQFVRWAKSLGDAAPRSINVNLSRNQLAQRDLPQVIRRLLDETGMRPEQLHLEITESAVMKDMNSGTQMLKAIREIGVKQCLDDFGTGHSSLACLHLFPIDVLKIDRSFVANIGRGRDFVALLHAAAQLAGNLGMSVVAEGVETADQVLTLLSMGCEFGQGYYFSKPMTGADVPAFLAAAVAQAKRAA